MPGLFCFYFQALSWGVARGPAHASWPVSVRGCAQPSWAITSLAIDVWVGKHIQSSRGFHICPVVLFCFWCLDSGPPFARQMLYEPSTQVSLCERAGPVRLSRQGWADSWVLGSAQRVAGALSLFWSLRPLAGVLIQPVLQLQVGCHLGRPQLLAIDIAVASNSVSWVFLCFCPKSSQPSSSWAQASVENWRA
jgi:hypothetical protein